MSVSPGWTRRRSLISLRLGFLNISQVIALVFMLETYMWTTCSDVYTHVTVKNLYCLISCSIFESVRVESWQQYFWSVGCFVLFCRACVQAGNTKQHKGELRRKQIIHFVLCGHFIYYIDSLVTCILIWIWNDPCCLSTIPAPAKCINSISSCDLLRIKEKQKVAALVQLVSFNVSWNWPRRVLSDKHRRSEAMMWT